MNERLAVELEFVQCLANPAYLNCNKLNASKSFHFTTLFSLGGTGLFEGPEILGLP